MQRKCSVIGVHHVQITVPPGAEDAARDFYCGVLGLPEMPKPEVLRARGGLWLNAGVVEVHIGVEAGVDRRATKAHIAWQVSDLTAWRVHLHDAGVTVDESLPIPGYDRIEFRDPFGNRVELIASLSEERSTPVPDVLPD